MPSEDIFWCPKSYYKEWQQCRRHQYAGCRLRVAWECSRSNHWLHPLPLSTPFLTSVSSADTKRLSFFSHNQPISIVTTITEAWRKKNSPSNEHLYLLSIILFLPVVALSLAGLLVICFSSLPWHKAEHTEGWAHSRAGQAEDDVSQVKRLDITIVLIQSGPMRVSPRALAGIIREDNFPLLWY